MIGLKHVVAIKPVKIKLAGAMDAWSWYIATGRSLPDQKQTEPVSMSQRRSYILRIFQRFSLTHATRGREKNQGYKTQHGDILKIFISPYNGSNINNNTTKKHN